MDDKSIGTPPGKQNAYELWGKCLFSLAGDGTGTNFDINGHGSSAAFLLAAAVASKVPTVLTGNQTLSVGTGSDTTLTVPSGATHALMTVDTGGGIFGSGRTV
jgi:hypothetical protein